MSKGKSPFNCLYNDCSTCFPCLGIALPFGFVYSRINSVMNLPDYRRIINPLARVNNRA